MKIQASFSLLNQTAIKSYALYKRAFNVKAFSLIEVLTAVLVLAGFISIVVQISYGNNRRIKKTRQLQKISQLLETKMLDLKDEYRGASIINLPGEQQGEFKQDQGYTWSFITQPLTLPEKELILFLVQLPDNELNQKWIQTFKSVLSDTVVELKLTVNYSPKKGKSYHYSVSSYFVNFENAPDFILTEMSKMLPK